MKIKKNGIKCFILVPRSGQKNLIRKSKIWENNGRDTVHRSITSNTFQKVEHLKKILKKLIKTNIMWKQEEWKFVSISAGKK